MERYLTVKIDLEYPDEARHAIDEAIKTYEENKFKWTETEITAAKMQALRIMNRLCIDGYDIEWAHEHVDESSGCIAVWLMSPDPDTIDRPSGICVIRRQLWNLWIGKCVALCKATGRKIPQFILNKVGDGCE